MAAEPVLTFNATACFIVLAYYLIINVVMYVAMCIDKKHAIKDKRRVPEKNLYLLAVLGGGAGGLIAMVVKHHKNRHLDFVLVYTITAILHCLVVFFLFSKLVFGL